MEGVPDEYQCFRCNCTFTRHVWSLERGFIRMDFSTPVPESEVVGGEGMACYCSETCMKRHVPQMMQRERAHSAHCAGYGPIETCATCGGPVDMAEFHLTYGKSHVEQVSAMTMHPHWGRTSLWSAMNVDHSLAWRALLNPSFKTRARCLTGQRRAWSARSSAMSIG